MKQYGNNLILKAIQAPSTLVPPDFQTLKTIYENYVVNFEDITGRGKQIVIRNRKTNQIENNYELTILAEFADLWVKSADQRVGVGSNPKTTRAFEPPNDKIFCQISKLVSQSISNTGTFDPASIYDKVTKNSNYKYTETIAFELFSTNKNLRILYPFYAIHNHIIELESELAPTTTDSLHISSPEEENYDAAYITVTEIRNRCQRDGLNLHETHKVIKASSSMQQVNSSLIAPNNPAFDPGGEHR